MLPLFADIPVLCFTATAPPAAQKALQKSLMMDSPTLITVNPDRPNIVYEKIMRPPSHETQDHLDGIV